MSDTPRTDAYMNVLHENGWMGDIEGFARQLERELNATRQCLRGLRGLVSDDSFAITFQSLAQYRAVVQREIEKSVVIAEGGGPNTRLGSTASQTIKSNAQVELPTKET